MTIAPDSILGLYNKPINGEVFPNNAINSGESWAETEPLITPEKVKQLHLFGIPLVSGMRDPNTGKNDVFPITQIAEHIDYAVAQAELDTGLSIFPRQFDKSVPFDPQEYKSYGYMTLPNRPIASLQEVSIKIANNEKLWTVPLEWISTSNLVWGQLNILTVGIIGVVTDTGKTQVIPDAAGNAMLLNALFSRDSYWMPEFWRVKYTAGFPDGKVPKAVNDLIGTITAIDILGLLATTYAKNTSQSLSVDGLSQGSSGLGPQLFDARIKLLQAKRIKLIKQLKQIFQLLFYSNNI
jgi:hypothetical protein